MTQIDYRSWVERMQTFTDQLRGLPGISVTAQVGGTITQEALDAVSKKWSTGLPKELRRFWIEGASELECSYNWWPEGEQLSRLEEVFESSGYVGGGGQFEPATGIFPGNADLGTNDGDFEELWGKEGLAWWRRCALFMAVGNGDYLALDPSTNPDDPAVIYLLHDGEESGQVSPSFTDFLAAWQELSYVGPEFWLLDYWLDRERGVIDVAKHKTKELRALLTPTLPASGPG